jgi:hypothetical protein
VKAKVTQTLASMGDFIVTVKNRVRQPHHSAQHQRSITRAAEQVSARRASMQRGIESILAREAEMTRNIERFKREHLKIYVAQPMGVDVSTLEQMRDQHPDIRENRVPELATSEIRSFEVNGFDDWRHRE